MSPRYSWTQPVCLACFRADAPDREPFLFTVPEVEVCSACGQDTAEGIYWRADPATLAFPTTERNT